MSHKNIGIALAKINRLVATSKSNPHKAKATAALAKLSDLAQLTEQQRQTRIAKQAQGVSADLQRFIDDTRRSSVPQDTTTSSTSLAPRNQGGGEASRASVTSLSTAATVAQLPDKVLQAMVGARPTRTDTMQDLQAREASDAALAELVRRSRQQPHPALRIR